MQSPTLRAVRGPAAAGAAYLAASALDAWMAGLPRDPWQRRRRLTKPLLMPLLALGHRGQPALASLAQASSCAGDIALLADESDVWFRRGVIAFGTAHLAYTAALRPHSSSTPSSRRAAVAVAVGSALSSAKLSRDAARTREELARPVGVYGLAIGAMATTAARVPGDRPGGRQAQVGALLFVASDSLIGATTFTAPASPRRLETLVMVTYTAGQLLLARGLTTLAGDPEGGAAPPL